MVCSPQALSNSCEQDPTQKKNHTFLKHYGVFLLQYFLQVGRAALKVTFVNDNSMSQWREIVAFGLDSLEYIVQLSFGPEKYPDSLEMVKDSIHLPSKVWVRGQLEKKKMKALGYLFFHVVGACPSGGWLQHPVHVMS